MKRATFLEGVVLALIAASLGSVASTVLPSVVGTELAFRGLIAGLGVAYVVYLLRRSDERTGRLVTLTAWFLLAGISGLVVDDLLFFLLIHLGLVWFVRALYHQPGPMAALLDLALSLTALLVGIWAYQHTGSVFLSIWTYFLVQALFVAIPSADGRRRGKDADTPAPRDPFQLAYQNAEKALRKLSSL